MQSRHVKGIYIQKNAWRTHGERRQKQQKHIEILLLWMAGWFDGWMDGWDGWMDGMDGWMDGWDG